MAGTKRKAKAKAEARPKAPDFAEVVEAFFAAMFAQKENQRRYTETRSAPRSAPVGPLPVLIADDFLRDLMVLCHPDKHGGDARSVRTFQGLSALRDARKKQNGAR